MEPPPAPSALERFLAAHADLKRRIHATRIPIESKLGLRAMTLFYFSVPVVTGYFVMQWSNAARERNLGSGDRQRLLDAKKAWADGGPGGGAGNPTLVMARTPAPHSVPHTARVL